MIQPLGRQYGDSYTVCTIMKETNADTTEREREREREKREREREKEHMTKRPCFLRLGKKQISIRP